MDINSRDYVWNIINKLLNIIELCITVLYVEIYFYPWSYCARGLLAAEDTETKYYNAEFQSCIISRIFNTCIVAERHG
jgi:hypothetical protein